MSRAELIEKIENSEVFKNLSDGVRSRILKKDDVALADYFYFLEGVQTDLVVAKKDFLLRGNEVTENYKTESAKEHKKVAEWMKNEIENEDKRDADKLISKL